MEKVKARKLDLPKPPIRQLKPLRPNEMISYAQILANDHKRMKAIGDVIFEDDENKLPGWSFAMPSERMF